MSKPIAPDFMYRLLVQGVKEYAIYLLDECGVVLNWNAGAERAKGYTASEIVGRNYACFYSQEDQDRGVPRRNLAAALRKGHFATAGWRYRKDGSAFWASVAIEAIYDEDGDFLGFAKVTRDLTAEREAARLYEHQARHDSLTGLLNRAAVAGALEVEIERSGEKARTALHYIDLDRFKPVNDTFGHEAGDEVLKEVAARLKAVVGARGLVGRLGGDEFAVLQFDAPSERAVADMGEAIVTALNRPVAIGAGKVGNIGASVGIALAPIDGRDVAAVFRSADLALYRAKSDGRNCVRFFEPAMSERALARSILELKLRHAVGAGEFSLVYQPVVDSRTMRTIAYEALLRWRDQTGEDVPPSTFIPLAEELGLMPELGDWVLRTACRQAARWPHEPVVAVNLSATQLRQPNLADRVAEILAETGLDAGRLELEITETAILDDRVAARATLSRLRSLGIGIALDDFGTGFSSLSLVRELPLTRIKIDRSFVADIDAGNRSSAVVESVVALCRGLGLSITAEGVETADQREGLVASGCHELQGYLFGRPASAREWDAMDAAPAERA